MSYTAPTTFSTAVLVADPVAITGASNDGVGKLTNASCAFEVQSTTGAFLLPRMTTTQRNALTAVNGMCMYNTTTNSVEFYQNGTWLVDTGTVNGPGSSTNNAIAKWNGTTGTVLANSGIIIDGSNNITGANTLQVGLPASQNVINLTSASTGNAPVISATGVDTNIGMIFSSKGTGSFTFYSDGGTTVPQFNIQRAATAVNYVNVTGAATGSGPIAGAAGTDGNIDFNLLAKGTGLVAVQGTGTVTGGIKFWNTGNTFNTSLIAGANAANLALTLPIADGSANADATTIAVPLASNGSGVLSFSNRLPRYATGGLTATQVNNLFATPIEIIPAPGAGAMIVIDLLVVELVFGSANFAAGGNLYLQYGNTAHGTNFATQSAGIPAAFVTGGASAAISTTGTINTTTGLATSVAGNAAVTITNATGAFTTGTGCSLTWYVWYKIVPIT